MKYRDNVCAVIRRRTDSSVLFCHRKGFPKESGWQFPQGGIDTRKNLIDELKRELLEEIGTDDIDVLLISPNMYRYNFPEGIDCRHDKYRGQQQRWVLAVLNSEDTEISFMGENAEFDDFEWVSPEDVLERIVDFKKDVYEKALKDLGILS
jgi:putative (di)nucleoside polyphosphate hydrolase